MELTHYLSESFGTAEFPHDFPQSLTIHSVEGFRQILEGRAQVGPHLLAILSQLTGSKDHVRGPTMTAEAALTFRQETLLQVVVQTVEKDANEKFPGDAQQRDASMDDRGVLEFLRDFSLTLHILEECS
ncbi:hypothetical protein SprV_0401538200 [Sparganum proliferum]